jgi:hypothetical protein
MDKDSANSVHGEQGSSSMEEAAAYTALSRIGWDSQPPEQALAEFAMLAAQVFPEVSEASVTWLGDDRPRTAASSGDVAVRLDERQYGDRSGPCLDAAASGGTIGVVMSDADGPYPDFRQAARKEGVTHSLSVGFPSVGGSVGGALNLYNWTGEPFADDSIRIAGVFVGFAGIAIGAVGRDDDQAVMTTVQLQRAVAARVVASRAQGVVMARLGCTRERAFTRLTELAEQQGITFHEAARAVVDQAA